jgi:preprotein translocase subunit SecD
MLFRMKALLLCAMAGLVAPFSSAEDELAEKGGHSFRIRVEGHMDEAGAKVPVTAEQVDRAIRVIGQRLEGMGIAGIQAAREGETGILLKVPGADADQAARISAMLEKSCQLGLHEVSPRNDETDAGGKTLAQRVLEGEEIVPGYRALIQKGKDADGNDYETPILVNRRKALGGKDISMAAISHRGPDAVDVTLNGAGTDKMIALTKDKRPGIDRLAIVLDGVVMSAPVLLSVPLGRNFQINGLHEPGEAQSLAISLMHPLENGLKVENVTRVPPLQGGK